MAGFGFGWFDAGIIVVSPLITVKAADGIQPAAGVSGGAAIRIHRGFSFRAEFRGERPRFGHHPRRTPGTCGKRIDPGFARECHRRTRALRDIYPDYGSLRPNLKPQCLIITAPQICTAEVYELIQETANLASFCQTRGLVPQRS